MATELELVPAKLLHAMQLAGDMTPADVDELAACGQEPGGGLVEALKVSEVAIAALDEGHVAAMFGVRQLEPGRTLLGRRPVAQLWFLTGSRFRRRPLVSVRTARRVVGVLLEHYGELFNSIDARHVDALRFAELCGASFGPTHPMAPSGLPFVPFALRRC